MVLIKCDSSKRTFHVFCWQWVVVCIKNKSYSKVINEIHYNYYFSTTRILYYFTFPLGYFLHYDRKSLTARTFPSIYTVKALYLCFFGNRWWTPVNRASLVTYRPPSLPLPWQPPLPPWHPLMTVGMDITRSALHMTEAVSQNHFRS